MPAVYINVHLKDEILDPQGRAIKGAINRINFSDVTDVRQGKQFILQIEHDLSDETLIEIKKIAGTLLSNPVIENYSIEVKSDS